MDKKRKKFGDDIAGALYDFCGCLTTTGEEFMVGSSQNVNPLLEHLKKWAKKRKLNLGNPNVKDWNKEL